MLEHYDTKTTRIIFSGFVVILGFAAVLIRLISGMPVEISYALAGATIPAVIGIVVATNNDPHNLKRHKIFGMSTLASVALFGVIAFVEGMKGQPFSSLVPFLVGVSFSSLITMIVGYQPWDPVDVN
jgi:hypothetical protein